MTWTLRLKCALATHVWPVRLHPKKVTIIVFFMCAENSVPWPYHRNVQDVLQLTTESNLCFAVLICEPAHLHKLDTQETQGMILFPILNTTVCVFSSASDPAAEPHLCSSAGACTHLWVNWMTEIMCKDSRIHNFQVFNKQSIYDFWGARRLGK